LHNRSSDTELALTFKLNEKPTVLAAVCSHSARLLAKCKTTVKAHINVIWKWTTIAITERFFHFIQQKRTVNRWQPSVLLLFTWMDCQCVAIKF